MLEQVMSGQVGQLMAQINPAGFFQMSSLMLRTFKTKYSPEVSRILQQTAQMLGGNPQMEDAAALLAQQGQGQGDNRGSNSQDIKLPTNTNEGAA